jgi:DNA-binding MarR family transcriptional regulator
MTSCYCIVLRQAARKMSALYDEALAPLGINIAQLSLLRRVERAAPVSITDLARLCELDRSTAGRNVRVLRRLGFLQPVAAADQREAAVALTAQGSRILRLADPLWGAAQHRIETLLGANEAARLIGVLQAL